MGISDNQNISFLHQDKTHSHIHLYVNRINEKGQAVKDTFISNKASRIAEELAQERGFTLAKDVQQQKILQRQKENHKQIEYIKKASKEILQAKPRSVDEYAGLMKKKGISTEFKLDSKGNLVGAKFLVEGKSIKASDVSRDLSGKRIAKLIEKNAMVLIPDPLTKTIKVARTIGKIINKGMNI